MSTENDSTPPRPRLTCVGGPIHGRDVEDVGPYYMVPVRGTTPLRLFDTSESPLPAGNDPLACYYARRVVDDIRIYEHSCNPIHCPAARIDPFDHDTWSDGLRSGVKYARDRRAECGHLLAETRDGGCRACEREDRIRHEAVDRERIAREVIR